MFKNTKYVIYEEKIDKNSISIKKAFSNIDFVPAYSVKTNNIPHIIKRFYDNGFKIEVVSDIEIEYAKMVGVKLCDIIYNGPIKGELAFDVASDGGIICFDSYDDYIQSNIPKGTRCMFRIAIDIDNHIDTRFGTKSTEVIELIKKAKSDGMKIVGIHCHATKGRSLQYWKNRIDFMSNVYSNVKHMLDEHIIDFGGNMFSPMNCETAKAFGDYASYADYATLFEDNKDKLYGATVILEMGTSIVANVMDFLTEVLSIKKTELNTYVLLDCCKYHLGWATDTHNFDIEITPCKDVEKDYLSKATFVGRLCVENDVIYNGYSGKLSKGDIITFKDVGAYTVPIKSPFIINHAPIYYIDNSGNKKLIKREETATDIMTTYLIGEI